MDKSSEADLLWGQNAFGRYAVPVAVAERPAARAVLNGKVYEPGTLALMRAHVGTGDIVHAGTFFGDFLPALANALVPEARIWAFEPNRTSWAAAAQTIAANGLDNVVLTHGAVSDHTGILRFRSGTSEGTPLGGRSHVTEEAGAGITSVPALMLDFAVPQDRQVSILQLDVEGHEKAALRGAYHLIRRCRPVLILEYFDNLRWIRRLFPGLGYRFQEKVHGNAVFVPEDRRIADA